MIGLVVGYVFLANSEFAVIPIHAFRRSGRSLIQKLAKSALEANGDEGLLRRALAGMREKTRVEN
jgi:hypothetical protein